MEPSVLKINKALLDLASVAEVVLFLTPKAHEGVKNTKLVLAERTLLERIDGFRSIEQLLSISGDIVGVHATLGKLMAAGFVTSELRPTPAVVAPVPQKSIPPRTPAKAAPISTTKLPAGKPSIAVATPPAATARAPLTQRATGVPTLPQRPAPVPTARATPAPRTVPAPPPSELDTAKRLLAAEAKLLFGDAAAKLHPRIEACHSIEDIFDLIVKFQQYLAANGKVNPDVFLDRLTQALAAARKPPAAAKRASAP